MASLPPPVHNSQYVQYYEQPTKALQSKVVWLSGPCSCGKTTLGREIQQIDPKWEYVAQDVFFIREVESEIIRRFPDQCRKITKCTNSVGIFAALKRIDGIFSESVSKDDLEAAKLALAEIEGTFTDDWIAEFKKSTYRRPSELVLEKVQEVLASGKNVLLDGYGITCEKIQAMNPHTQVFHGLVYTSLEKSCQYVARRNQKAQDENNLNLHRFFGAMISSFNAMFEVCQEQTEHTIAAVDYQDLKTIFDSIERKLPQDGCKDFLFWYEMPLSCFRALRDKLLPNTSDTGKLYIQPKLEYDFVFTEEGTAQERAQKLLECLIKL